MARLVVGHGAPGARAYTLAGDSTTLGRSADNDIVIDDPSVSRFHANLSHRDGVYVLRDLMGESPQGTSSEPREYTKEELEDVRRMAPPVLRHRLVPTFRAEAEGVRARHIIEAVLDHVRP